ncbi:IS5/IS1182 family transposase [Petralouisia muris]|uniref:IS5/IS1182 family transposase n=1 Tax=Petralouisia muris TaxID=3032872 RepID=A0AC61RWX2_9FIRM|nr:transposase [Petralouisia muris]TGY96508.1 IS5/IS1182 family transposase [Petralouisia muris]
MIEQQQKLLLSPYMEIYELVIPKDNLLRQIKELVDFGFIYEELIDKYCLDNGRNAISPVRMFKYLLLKSIYELSDIDVAERSKYDMSFKYFLDMAPEEAVINPSSLTKFRKLRLKDMNLLDMLIGKTVQIALEKGIIKSKSIIVDATHTKSRHNQKTPRQALLEQSKKLRRAVYEIDESMKELFPAKNTEAKTGHKTADTAFFGYKTHMAMSEERIITAATVTNGEKTDGKELPKLIQKSREAGMEVKTVIGDKAYSEQQNIEAAQDGGYELISRLNSVITQGKRTKEDEFEFNKDAGMYQCKAGHLAVRKYLDRREKEKKNKNPRMIYFFDIEKCKYCPYRDGCYKEGAKKKTYSETLKSDAHSKQAEFQETEHFKEKMKERYKIAAKNSELKHRHGYDTASSSGLINMEIQGAMAIFAVNLKRIIILINEK